MIIELWIIAAFLLGMLFEYLTDVVAYIADRVQANTLCRWQGHEWFNDVAEGAHTYPDLCCRCGLREYHDCEDSDDDNYSENGDCK